MKRLAPFVLVLLALSWQNALCQDENDDDENRPSREEEEEFESKLQAFPMTRRNCFAKSYIDLVGAEIFQRPLPASGPDDCCQECKTRPQCVGWVFRACCNHCVVFSDITYITRCQESDCVAGILDSNLRRTTEEAYRLVPQETFKGLGITCNQQAFYRNVTVVFRACNDVQRLCTANSREVPPLDEPPTVEYNCSMTPDLNMDGSDYNDGFRNVVLSPLDCCKDCMRDRGCHAWQYIANGQCWKKWRVPPQENWRPIPGDVAGFRENLPTRCGDEVRDLVLMPPSPYEQDIVNASNKGECCDGCRARQACVVWSYFPDDDGEFQCRIIFNAASTPSTVVGAITGSVVADLPVSCDAQSYMEDSASPMHIARAYNAPCASILHYGPGEPTTPDCQNRAEGRRIFRESLERNREIV